MSIEGTLGFLGFGNMGQAICHGLIDAGTLRADQIVVYDVDPAKAAAATQKGVRSAGSPDLLAAESDILLLATKPQDMATALESVSRSVRAHTLVISIAAGVGIRMLKSHLNDDVRIARVMPNTPALLRAGAAAIAFSDNCTGANRDAATEIFEAVGIAVTVPEEQMDAVTALSGSGPAYFFYFVECLVEAGKELGLDEEKASKLAIQTAMGAGRMLAESGETAAVLRERVTSRGGTTFAALETLREKGFPGIVEAALRAAAERSKELG